MPPGTGLDVGAVVSSTCLISARLQASLRIAAAARVHHVQRPSRTPATSSKLPDGHLFFYATGVPATAPRNPEECACSIVPPCVSDSPSLSLTESFLDYVFVDEHNRHKRLKGMDSMSIAGMRRDEPRQLTDWM